MSDKIHSIKGLMEQHSNEESSVKLNFYKESEDTTRCEVHMQNVTVGNVVKGISDVMYAMSEDADIPFPEMVSQLISECAQRAAGIGRPNSRKSDTNRDDDDED